MKPNQLLVALSLITLIAIGIYGCSKGGGTTTPPNPCASKTITVTATTTNTNAGASTGSISATTSGSSSFTFSINSGAFQASGNFSNLAKGTYTITAKDSDGCTGSAQFTVNENDACLGKTITISGSVTEDSDPCSNTGKLTITAGGSTNFTYNINGGSFQASASFTNVPAGSVTIGCKDGDGCVKTSTVTVGTLAAGVLFTDVKAIVQTKCAISGCHNGTQAPNFTQDCTIAANAARIKARAVDQGDMPPTGPLTQAEKNKITAWVTAGGRVSN
ncbi:MAG: hypothetical protein SFU21_13415 [Flavihumibacter sp.]|nr:hypothetical protein [Flavihumibacter sp.]